MVNVNAKFKCNIKCKSLALRTIFTFFFFLILASRIFFYGACTKKYGDPTLDSIQHIYELLTTKIDSFRKDPN
jgi:hypothetical protein